MYLKMLQHFNKKKKSGCSDLFPFSLFTQCINNLNRQQNINSSLLLPDKTLQFVKDHPLLADPVQPIGNGPRLIAKDVNYTQIAVERVKALDNRMYDVIFTGTGKILLK